MRLPISYCCQKSGHHRLAVGARKDNRDVVKSTCDTNSWPIKEHCMQTVLTPALLLSLFALQLSCRPTSTPEILAGRYKLSSAVLNEGGKFRELTCKGEFEFLLAKNSESVQIEPTGEATCTGPQPASFSEILGGDCDLASFALVNNSEGEIYSQSGATLSCDSAPSDKVVFTIQAVSKKALRLSRSRGHSGDTRSELIFVRSANEL